MKTVKIRDREIGDGHPPYILAEIGINHMGNFDMAKRLVELASQNGADGVKFQALDAHEMIHPEKQLDMWRIVDDNSFYIQQFKQLRRMTSLDFIITVFDNKVIDLLKLDIAPDAVKIASGDITNYPLLQAAGGCGLPVILSTGASDGREVGAAVELLNHSGCEDIVILHCVSLYPTGFHQVNLKAMDKLRVFGYPVGLSDHTTGLVTPIAAMARGASFIEKHFTFNNYMPGDDHLCSMTPIMLKDLAEASKEIDLALYGSEIKEPYPDEEPQAIRRGLYAARDIKAGETLTEADIRLLRPQGELSAMDYPKLVGATLTSDLTALEEITRDHVDARVGVDPINHLVDGIQPLRVTCLGKQIPDDLQKEMDECNLCRVEGYMDATGRHFCHTHMEKLEEIVAQRFMDWKREHNQCKDTT